MPRPCAVSTCSNYKDATDTVHRFPSKDHQYKRKFWEEFAVNASGGTTKIKAFDNYGLCTKHFKRSDYQDGKTRLKSDAMPSDPLGIY